MERVPRVTFHTLGCKLNQAESESLAWQFAESGCRVAGGDEADVCVVNTCTVTHVADRKSRHLVRLMRRKNPDALIVATGCYAEREPRKLTQAGADLVVGNDRKGHLLELLKYGHIAMPQPAAGPPEGPGISRVRSFVKIQDGCSGYCSYCVVPEVRRREYSLPAAEILQQVDARVSAGYREIVLTGTKIGTFRHGGVDLKQLVEQILAHTGTERLHLSSLQPQEVSEGLLGLWRDRRLCRHFHLALQSGSRPVLERMRRRYSLDDYRKAVSLIRDAVPDAAITTDVIAGFPGESSDEFEESYSFCREMDFAHIHVFTYSPRPGTAASEMRNQVGDRLKREHSLRMLELAQQCDRKFREGFLGQTARVLWEREVGAGSGVYSGLSDNYVRVFAQSSRILTNQLSTARLVGLHHQGLSAEVVR